VSFVVLMVGGDKKRHRWLLGELEIMGIWKFHVAIAIASSLVVVICCTTVFFLLIIKARIGHQAPQHCLLQ